MPVAGVTLLVIHRVIKRRPLTIVKEWKLLALVCSIFIIQEIAWYDSVSHIGAGKVSLIYAPLETVLVVGLAWLFLHERLNRAQILGTIAVLVGIVMALSVTTTISRESFGIGEIETIVTAVSGAILILLSVKLINRHDATQMTIFWLLSAGIMFQFAWFFYYPLASTVHTPAALWLLLPLAAIPLFVFFFQAASYSKIGAALTSIIVVSHIVLVVIIQTIVGAPFAVPENLWFAIVAGALSVAGITVLTLGEKKDVVQEKIK